jgi:hypothetical protein
LGPKAVARDSNVSRSQIQAIVNEGKMRHESAIEKLEAAAFPEARVQEKAFWPGHLPISMAADVIMDSCFVDWPPNSTLPM